MDQTEVRAVALSALTSIAPEVDVNELLATQPLRDQVDLDSMDWLNFLIALHERLHVDIPEADYEKLVTLADLTDYLTRRLSNA
jgi:acyl carrier protein